MQLYINSIIYFSHGPTIWSFWVTDMSHLNLLNPLDLRSKQQFNMYMFQNVGQVFYFFFQLFWWFLDRMRIIIFVSFALCLSGMILIWFQFNAICFKKLRLVATPAANSAALCMLFAGKSGGRNDDTNNIFVSKRNGSSTNKFLLNTHKKDHARCVRHEIPCLD